MSAARLSPLFTWRARICDDDSSPFSSTERLVALVLSLHMSERGDSCFPGIPRLARECNLGRRTIQRSIAGLERAGYLVVERPAKVRGKGAPNRYRAVVPESPLDALQRAPQRHPSGEEGRPSVRRRVSPTTGKGATVSPEVVIEDVNDPDLTEQGRAVVRSLIDELSRKKTLAV
jgi:hypothetical protein